MEKKSGATPSKVEKGRCRKMLLWKQGYYTVIVVTENHVMIAG